MTPARSLRLGAAVLALSTMIGCSGSGRPGVGERAAPPADETGYQVGPGEALDRNFSYRAVATGTLFVYHDPDLEADTTRVRGQPVQLEIRTPYNRHEAGTPSASPSVEGAAPGGSWPSRCSPNG